MYINVLQSTDRAASPRPLPSGVVERLRAPAARATRPLRIALAGYGIVGQALAARLADEPGFEIVAILVRDPAKPRDVPPPCPPTGDTDTFLAAPADILIDVLSCARTGLALSRVALGAGCHVASASKRAVSGAHAALVGAARRGGALLRYSAAVGGAAPVLETVAAARAHGPVREVAAVLNGTVNFILDRLSEGLDFAEALARARAAGFAEEDPSEDLSGADAAAKLKLIAAEAFGIDPARVAVETETLDAARAARIAASGERWVQRASLRRTEAGIEARVALTPAQAAGGLPALPDEWNCARATCRDGRAFACEGRGAGGPATAEALIADLFRICGTHGRPRAVPAAATDRLVPAGQSAALAAGLPDARLHIFDCLYGHDMFLKEADRLGALVRPFLEDA